MLTMDDIKYIRRMYEKEGCSIREIMKRTGYHYETVSKYLDMEDFNLPIYRTDKKPSRLDPLKPVIDQWFEDDMKAPRKQRHTAKRVYDRLVAEYPEEIGVRLRTVQYYVNEKKKELYSNRSEGYCETRFFRATGSQYREPLARGDQSRRRGAESHRSKHKYKEPPELRRRRLFVFNQLNVWKYCL